MKSVDVIEQLDVDFVSPENNKKSLKSDRKSFWKVVFTAILGVSIFLGFLFVIFTVIIQPRIDGIQTSSSSDSKLPDLFMLTTKSQKESLIGMEAEPEDGGMSAGFFENISDSSEKSLPLGSNSSMVITSTILTDTNNASDSLSPLLENEVQIETTSDDTAMDEQTSTALKESAQQVQVEVRAPQSSDAHISASESESIEISAPESSDTQISSLESGTTFSTTETNPIIENPSYSSTEIDINSIATVNDLSEEPEFVSPLLGNNEVGLEYNAGSTAPEGTHPEIESNVESTTINENTELSSSLVDTTDSLFAEGFTPSIVLPPTSSLVNGSDETTPMSSVSDISGGTSSAIFLPFITITSHKDIDSEESESSVPANNIQSNQSIVEVDTEEPAIKIEEENVSGAVVPEVEPDQTLEQENAINPTTNDGNLGSEEVIIAQAGDQTVGASEPESSESEIGTIMIVAAVKSPTNETSQIVAANFKSSVTEAQTQAANKSPDSLPETGFIEHYKIWELASLALISIAGLIFARAVRKLRKY